MLVFVVFTRSVEPEQALQIEKKTQNSSTTMFSKHTKDESRFHMYPRIPNLVPFKVNQPQRGSLLGTTAPKTLKIRHFWLHRTF